MDQVKKLLALAKKNIFWIVSALTIMLSLVGYWLAKSNMNSVFKAQAEKIDQQYSAMQTISNEVATHPNAKTHQEMDKQIKSLVADVETAWKKQYERQAEILKWPVGPIPQKFIDKVEKLRPIELKLEFPLTPEAEPLVVGDRVQYAKYINDQFPRLARIIGTEWVGTPPVGNAAGGMGMGMDMGMGMGSDMAGGSTGYSGDTGSGMGAMGGGMSGAMGAGMPGMTGFPGMERKPDLVTWPKPVQDAVIADVQTWRSKYPSTHDVLYTQENIWILEGLLNIIAQVNVKANAVANFQATVKEIEFLRIGRSAVGKVGVIDPPMAAGGMGMDGSMMGMDGSGMMGMDGSGMMGMDGSGMMGSGMEGGMAMGMDGSGMMGSGMEGGMGMVMPTPDPANGRYVDAAYAPITGDDLRTKMKSSSPEDAYFAVAKKVPVRMRLKVDQRRIQTLIAECGNANLLFEIRQVRIGDTTPAPSAGGGGFGMDAFGGGGMSGTGASMSGDGGGMMAGGMDTGMGSGMGSDMGSDMGMGMGMGGMGMGMMPQTAKVWDIPVEIYGVVYLFNPVDTSKLGLDKVTAETEVTDKVEVSADEAQAAAPASGDNAQPNAAGAGQPNNVGAAGQGAARPPASGQAPPGQAPPGQAPPGQAPPGQAPAGGQAPGPGPAGNP